MLLANFNRVHCNVQMCKKYAGTLKLNVHFTLKLIGVHQNLYMFSDTADILFKTGISRKEPLKGSKKCARVSLFFVFVLKNGADVAFVFLEL